MGGLLDFSFDIHHLLVNDLDPHPVKLMAGFGLVFPDWEIEKLQSTKKSKTLWGKNLFLYFLFWFFYRDRFTVQRMLINYKLLFSNLLLIVLVNNANHLHLRDRRMYFKVEEYFRVTWSRMDEF